MSVHRLINKLFNTWEMPDHVCCTVAVAKQYLRSRSSASRVGFCWPLAGGGWDASSCWRRRRWISCRISLWQGERKCNYASRSSLRHCFVYGSQFDLKERHGYFPNNKNKKWDCPPDPIQKKIHLLCIVFGQIQSEKYSAFTNHYHFS